MSKKITWVKRFGAGIGIIICAYGAWYGYENRPFPPLSHTGARITTNFGTITFTFNRRSPLNAEHVIGLIQDHAYDGTRFHRVLSNVFIQGGDLLSTDSARVTEWGNGSFAQIPDEFHGEKMVRGTVAMANQGPNTNGAQFFITSKKLSMFQGYNTIIGTVTSGQDVVDRISRIPSTTLSKPKQDVIIQSITLQ